VFSVLVVTEIALAVLLVIGAGLLVRSYVKLTNTNPGCNPEKVLTFFMNVPGRTEISFKQNPGSKPEIIGSYAPMANFFRELLERIKGLPGVKTVAATTNLPLAKYQYGVGQRFNLPDQPGANTGATAQSAATESVSPDFFRALEIRLLAGRALLPLDRPGSPGVAVVNQAFARRFLNGQNPLGQRIRFPENLFVVTEVGFQLSHRTVDELEIVGVVEDVRYLKLADPPEPRIYLSNEQWIARRQTVVVRTTIENPESLVGPIRKEIASMDRLLNAEFVMFPEVVSASFAKERLATTLLVLFGLAALALAAVGIYGLMSYSVVQRTGEIAVRSAMGASACQILTLVMGWGIWLALGGTIIGIIGAVALRRIVASQLYDVAALDIRVFVLASMVLFGVAVLACFVPAQRATRIAPAELLRIE
jgi:putative ABC transport system permease protein